jgi:hypothetical protein
MGEGTEPVTQRSNDGGQVDDHEGPDDGLTQSGRKEWRNFRAEFDATASAELRRMCCKRDELNREDIIEVRRTVLRSMSDPATSEPLTAGREHRRVGTGLVAVGSAGVGALAGQLHSPWQIGLFVAMIVVGLIGVVLAYRPDGDPPASPGR